MVATASSADWLTQLVKRNFHQAGGRPPYVALTGPEQPVDQRTTIALRYSRVPRLIRRAVFFALVAVALSACGGPTSPNESGRACFAELDARAVAYRPITMAEPKDPRCVIPTPVRVTAIGVRLGRPAAMSCFLAEKLDAFEHGAMQRIAVDDLGHRVVRIEHLGAYSCRADTSRHDRLSEHAYGLAIDISGFRLADGETVSVERDWSRPGPKRTFLHHVARAACGYFSVVLTPDSNADHFNHFHFDLGPYRLCSV